MHAHVGSIHFHVGLSAVKNAEIDYAGGQLDIDPVWLQLCHLSLGPLVKAHHVGGVKLNFCPGAIVSRYLISQHDGSIYGGGGPRCAVAMHGGNLAANFAEPPNTGLSLGLFLRRTLGLLGRAILTPADYGDY